MASVLVASGRRDAVPLWVRRAGKGLAGDAEFGAEASDLGFRFTH